MDSKTVFELRNEAKSLEGISKLNKLTEALNIAQRLFSSEPYDEWIQKAFAYTLIDLSKYYISNRNINQAGIYFNQLLSINFEETDNIIENQKNFLRPKIDVNYAEVQKAEELSKNGHHQDSLNIFKKLITENRLTEIHHEAYGWVIYRYIKDKENELTSIQVRTFLRDYMDLKNGRPSMLHSCVLNFALQYSKGHTEFKLFNFFKLWGASNLRIEDKTKQLIDGNEISSLVRRVLRHIIEQDYEFDIDYLISNIRLSSSFNFEEIENVENIFFFSNNPITEFTSQQRVLDLLREPFFWKLFRAHKEHKHLELWGIFNKYNQTFSKYEKSKWHSEILSIADRFMQETEEWRFLEFFKIWNPENLLYEDWREVEKDDKFYKPLAIKCIKKTFEIIKTQNKEFSEDWLLPIYSKAVKLYPEDNWLLRENALLLIKNNELESSINIYRKLVLELGDKSYIWNEFSTCFKDKTDLKIGMLSKAIQLEKNEDFLGDTHLELAKILFDNGLVENYIIELNSYKRHRELKGWRLSELYIEISGKTKNQITNLKDNKSLYDKYIPIAEQYAYEEIDWTEVILVDKWKNDEGKERIAFTNGKTIDFSIGSRRFSILKHSSLGEVYKFKLYKQEIKKEVEDIFFEGRTITITEYKYLPLIVEKTKKLDWSILDDIYATIDYINTEKNIIHAITSENKEVFFPKGKIQLQIGDFIKAKYFTKKIRDEIRIELKDLKIINKEIAVVHFPKIIAVIDGVNKEKNLFHYVGDTNVQGIIKFTETNIIPVEGKFLEIFYTSKKHRTENRTIIKTIQIRETEEKNPKLVKSINGKLELKYKRGGSTIDYFELDEDETSKTFPDFGFVGDFYVPKNILSENKITSNCNITATAIFLGDKWKIIKLEKA